MMLKLLTALAFLAIAAISCSDDDGSNVEPKGAGMGGSAGDGMSGAAGSDASGSGGMAGSGGSSGAGGSGGSSGGPPDCTPVDAGAPGDAGAVDAGVGDASADGGISGVVSFATDIHPIFVASCGPCHVGDGQGGHNVGGADVDAAYADAVRVNEALLERTNGGGMPPSYADPPNNCADGDGPGDPGCLSVEEYALLQTWVAQCFPR